MRNIIKRIIAVFLVIIANISLVACDVNILDTSVFGEVGTHGENKTEDESENENGSEVVLSVNATEQSSDTWKMTYKGCEVSKQIDSFTTAENGKEFVFVFLKLKIFQMNYRFSICLVRIFMLMGLKYHRHYMEVQLMIHFN